MNPLKPTGHVMIIERTVEGNYFRFDHDQYHEVWKARKALGLPVNQQKNLTDSNLLGKRLYSSETKKEYIIEKVIQEYYCGWFVKLLIQDGKGSHGVRDWENISCRDPIILNEIALTKEKYQLMV